MAKPGISKSTGYLTRVFCVEYDLNAMIEAYGADNIKLMVDGIVTGKIKGIRQEVQRWCADTDLYAAIKHEDDSDTLAA